MADIAIIGTGRMGKAFAKRLSALGKDVVLGSRTPDAADTLEEAKACGASAASVQDAADQCDTVLLATPYAAQESTLTTLGDLSGKTVIDVTNAVGMAEDGLMAVVSDRSAGEEVQAALPGAHVVKAFSTIGFHVITDPKVAGGPVSVLIAGDHDDANAQVATLAADLGFEPVLLGPLRQSRAIEGLATLYMVPYLQGRMADAFEFHLRGGAAPTKSEGVRAAG